MEALGENDLIKCKERDVLGKKHVNTSFRDEILMLGSLRSNQTRGILGPSESSVRGRC